jgi:hypothetical protein
MLSSSSHIVDNSNTMKSYSAMSNLNNENTAKNKAFSRNHRISNGDSEYLTGKASKNTYFNKLKAKTSSSSRCKKKEVTHRNTYLSKHNISHQDEDQKVRAASSSLNRKGEDRFLFRPPTHGTNNMPTPKNRTNLSTHKSKEDSIAIDITTKMKKDYIAKSDKESDSNSKAKRSSLQRVKRVNKIPLGKRDINVMNNNSRSTSRSKQLSAKNRLVYKKDSMKALNANNPKSEISLGLGQPSAETKIENKENDFTQMNQNNKLSRTSSCRDNKKSMKSMGGIRKLYTLKANNSISNRGLGSQR